MSTFSLGFNELNFANAVLRESPRNAAQHRHLRMLKIISYYQSVERERHIYVESCELTYISYNRYKIQENMSYVHIVVCTLISLLPFS